MRTACLILLSLALLGCTPHRALRTLAVADSLRAEGQSYGDSMALAQAVSDLRTCRLVYPNDYARTCYHYARLLTDRQEERAAMQHFLRITRLRNIDPVLRGRAYSNMARIAGQQHDERLAISLYEQSARSFLNGRDTLLYAYSLTNIAWQLGYLQRRTEALHYVDSALSLVTDDGLIQKAAETRAAICYYAQDYDAALSYMALPAFPDNAYTCLLKAQTCYASGRNDSATLFAKQVPERTQNPYYLIDAYYILLHDSASATPQELACWNAARTQMLLLCNRTDIEHTQALDFYLGNRKKARWLLCGAIVLTVIALSLFFTFLYYRRKGHRVGMLGKLLHSMQAERIHIEKQIERARQDYRTECEKRLEETCRTLRKTDNFRQDMAWSNYEQMCLRADNRLDHVITCLRPFRLSQKETRLCVLVLIGFSNRQIADLLPYAESGIGKFKYMVARKLGTPTNELRMFLLNIVLSQQR